jgi:hypothetical protein
LPSSTRTSQILRSAARLRAVFDPVRTNGGDPRLAADRTTSSTQTAQVADGRTPSLTRCVETAPARGPGGRIVFDPRGANGPCSGPGARRLRPKGRKRLPLRTVRRRLRPEAPKRPLRGPASHRLRPEVSKRPLRGPVAHRRRPKGSKRQPAAARSRVVVDPRGSNGRGRARPRMVGQRTRTIGGAGVLNAGQPPKGRHRAMAVPALRSAAHSWIRPWRPRSARRRPRQRRRARPRRW